MRPTSPVIGGLMLFTLVYVGFAIHATHAALFSHAWFAVLFGPGLFAYFLDGALVLLHLIYWFFLVWIIYKGFGSIA